MIYRIRPDGLWDAMWDSGEDSPYDLVIEPSGSLLIGTGTEGKIFRVSGDPARATLLARTTARQVTALLRESSGRIVGVGSNPGKLFAISPASARRGTYDSDVRDAGTVASWGVIRWRATAAAGEVTIATRSGNTATPDDTWSAWSKPYSNSAGEQIASPNARYLQWRAVLAANGAQLPVLTSVTTAYLPRNLRPEISSITVHPPERCFNVRSRRGNWKSPGSRTTPPMAALRDSRRRHRAHNRSRRRRLVDGCIRRDCRHLSGRPTTRTMIGFSTT
jgi:hypothetical protein